MSLSYQQPGFVLQRGVVKWAAQIKDLQRDLRRLGYLRTGIDGNFGKATETAVKALQYDLLTNAGKGSDGDAPVSIKDYNKNRVPEANGVVDQNLAACLAEMLGDGRFAKVPDAADPAAENRRIATELAAMRSAEVPVLFLLGIFRQESGARHFMEPSSDNDDNFVIVGLDRNAEGKPAITSRGYGVGQYTLFHHPPSAVEVSELILNFRKNITKAVRELRSKFDRFVNGTTPGTRAEDRQAEFGRGGLRMCKYAPEDARYLTDCRQCLRDAGQCNIRAGATRIYEGAQPLYEPTQYHREREYKGVPIRRNIGCDWPYAVRRYNGGGMNSYHYQTKVLLHVLDS
ncbi:MAG: peptidoglycan-binding domain-containing protein [Bryobacteraceae bacterium]